MFRKLFIAVFLTVAPSAISHAETSEIFQCEGVMEYQYEHIGAAYDELWRRGTPVSFSFAKQEKQIKFIDEWHTLEGLMPTLPTLGGNIHAIGSSRMIIEGKNKQTDSITSFFMGYGGNYTIARNGVSGIVTSIGKCKPLS